MSSAKVAFIIGGGNLGLSSPLVTLIRLPADSSSASASIKKLESLGYQVALASRKPDAKSLPESVKTYTVDLEQPESALSVYDKVSSSSSILLSALTYQYQVVKEVGIPSVVLYTGSFFLTWLESCLSCRVAWSSPFTSFEDQTKFLTAPVNTFAKTLNVNVASVYAVLQAFTKHGASLPKDMMKIAIMVGNPFNDQVRLSSFKYGWV